MSKRVFRTELQVGDRIAIRNREGLILDNAEVLERIEEGNILRYRLEMYALSMDEDECYEVINRG